MWEWKYRYIMIILLNLISCLCLVIGNNFNLIMTVMIINALSSVLIYLSKESTLICSLFVFIINFYYLLFINPILEILLLIYLLVFIKWLKEMRETEY